METNDVILEDKALTRKIFCPPSILNVFFIPKAYIVFPCAVACRKQSLI